MADYKTLQGILALIDIVNFTPQATKLGSKNTQKYLAYFQDKVTAIAGKHGFQVIKSMGDAVLIFGPDAEDVLEIMVDLFEREKLEDRFGFVSQYRMVGHSGFFQFQMAGGSPVDLVSQEGIKLFRMEKIAHSWELVVTPALYQGIQSLLTSKNLEASRLVLAEPLKGFDNLEWQPLFYKLRIAREQEGVSNLLEPRLERLEQEVQQIPVFGNIYPPVPMENNFINLSLVCGEPHSVGFQDVECFKRSNKKLLRGGKGGGFLEKSPPGPSENDWPFSEYEAKGDSRTEVVVITVSTLYAHFRSGVILGLPGAGKTTILRYLAFRDFQTNKTTVGDQRQVVLFVPCRDVPLYDSWYKKRFAVEPSEPSCDDVLEFMTWVFLEGRSEPGDLAPTRWEEFQETAKRVKQAFKEGRVTLLVDALDEAADIEIRERIKQLFVILYPHLGGNRIFLTSRPLERIHLDQAFKTCRVPGFRVLSLTMEQVRAVARHIMTEDSAVYKKFDTAIWQEEVVVKMAATPITALLITAYFQAYEKFDHRFPMYDLLVKFILLKVWDNIKTGAFPFGNLELFFQEIREPGFFNKHKETRILYDALASLCYQLFYESADGTVQRSVNEETLLGHFCRFIRERLYYYDEKTARAEALQWRERFRRDHLLLQAGKQEYVFVHSTVMEFLAAYYIVEKMQKDKDSLPQSVKTCVSRESLLNLETVPIAAGHSLLAGYTILAVLRDLAQDITYNQESFYRQAVKCLAEVEWLLHKTFQGLRLKSLKKPIMDIVRKNYHSVDWVYLYLKKLVLSENKEELEQALERFDLQLRLNQPTLMDEYLEYSRFEQGDSQLVELRKYLLLKLVQKEVLEKWFKIHKEKEIAIRLGEEITLVHPASVLRLDSPDYHPDDKNFAYYQTLIGPELVGFFGSPNMKHSGEVLSCAFSPDGKTFVSGSEDGTLKLWKVSSGKEIRTLGMHQYPFYSCTFSPLKNSLIFASSDQSIGLWDVSGGMAVLTFMGHNDKVTFCTVSTQGNYLLSASYDYTLKLWNTENGKQIRTFIGHKAVVLRCAFSPNDATLLSASSDNTLKLWDAVSGKEIQNFIGHKDAVNGCAFYPRGTLILSASSDKTLKLWDVDNGKEILTLIGHKGKVLSCDFSPDGTEILSTSDDNTLKVWDATSGNELRTLTGHQAAVRDCAFSSKGTTIISASDDSTLKLWDKESGKEIFNFTGHKGYVTSCAFSPKGNILVSASDDNTLKLWDIDNGREIHTFTGHKNLVLSCSFSPDGNVILSASKDHTLKLWDVNSGKEIRTFIGHKNFVLNCAFSPQGTAILSSSADNTLKLWDTKTADEILTFIGHKDTVWYCAFSPNGKTFISASYDKTLKLWDVSGGKEIHTFTGHRAPVLCCAFSIQGNLFLSASEDKTLKLWDVISGKTIRNFIGHKASVLSCAFSLDEKIIISTSTDQTLKLWDIVSGKCIKTINLPWTAYHVSISPSNPNLVITGNTNGTLTLFDFKESMEKQKNIVDNQHN